MSKSKGRRQRRHNGDAESIQQSAIERQQRRETTEVVRAINEGEAELESGGGQPASEAFAEVRQRLGWK